jgi:hypothetical protein
VHLCCLINFTTVRYPYFVVAALRRILSNSWLGI